MPILNQLSSQTGDRSETSNRKVAIQCLDDPELLLDVAAGLREKNHALVGDCAEVLTKVAEDRPEWVAPYAEALQPLLTSRNTRVRWEAMHALALVAHLTPEIIAPRLPQFAALFRSDKSVIVRDYATDAVAGYASTSEAAAEAAFPMLKEMLTLWNGKQAGHALLGMIQVARQLPEKRPELRRIAEDFSTFPRTVVRRSAKALLKSIDSIGGSRDK